MTGATFKTLRRGLLAGTAALFLGAAGCTPITNSHGYTPRADELETVQAGLDTRGSVERKLGRPSTVGAMSDDVWLYISQRTETYGFYEREIVEQTVVLIAFDEKGIVTDVSRYGLEDGRIIDLVTRETPTGGRKLTILQQAFGNLGRFGREGGIDQIGK